MHNKIMSMLIFVLIAILFAVLLVTFVSMKLPQKQMMEENDNNMEQRTVEDEDSLRRTGLYCFEYKLIPIYVDILKRNSDIEFKLIDASYWQKDIVSMTQPQYIEWDEISCEIVGDRDSEYVFLYEFPEPFDVPLAKYGAVYVNKQKRICKYYTLEKSLNGYVLCSTSTENHSNYGERSDMSKEEFIKDICNVIGTDDISQRDWRLAKDKNAMDKTRYYKEKVNNMVPLNDSDEQVGLEKITDKNFNEIITGNTNIVICFYDVVDLQDKRLTSKQCKFMLPILSSMADEYRGVKVCVYDVYSMENETVRETYNIMALPTLLFFRNGKEIKKHIGVCRKEDLRSWFEELLTE